MAPMLQSAAHWYQRAVMVRYNRVSGWRLSSSDYSISMFSNQRQSLKQELYAHVGAFVERGAGVVVNTKPDFSIAHIGCRLG